MSKENKDDVKASAPEKEISEVSAADIPDEMSDIEEITGEIAPEAIAPAKKKNHTVINILLALLICAVLARIGMLVFEHISAVKGRDSYEKLQNEYFNPPSEDMASILQAIDTIVPIDVVETPDTEDEGWKEEPEVISYYKEKLPSLITLKNIVPDFVGWIFVDNTSINYPIVQGKDNSFYLTHDIYGQYLDIGSIFVDYRCNRDFKKNYNTVLYGHRTRSDLIFNHLAYFLEKDFFENNRYIMIYTDKAILVYEVYTVFKTKADSDFNRVEFESDEHFIEHMESYRVNAVNDREEIKLSANDRILSLSTCTNVVNTERYVVQARLIAEKSSDSLSN